MNDASLRRVAGDLHTVQGALPAGAIELAYHASLPVAVDPPLLHLTRVNFLPDLPYDVEARLLLSPLFHELGDGLYEIKSELRDLLLAGLVARFGPDRLRRTAVLLERYAYLPTSWPDNPELVHAQRLTALHVLRPEEAQRWLTRNESLPGGGGLGRTWFVAMRRQIASVPDDEGLLDRALREAVARLTRPDQRRRVVDVRAVVALMGMPGGPSSPKALDALRAAALDPDPVVGRMAGEAVARLGPASPTTAGDGGGSDQGIHGEPDDRTDPDVLPDPAVSRVVLIDDDSAPAPGTGTAFREFVDTLADPDVWGIDPAHCQVPTGSASAVGAAIRQAAGEVGPTGLLLIHYSGRGRDTAPGDVLSTDRAFRAPRMNPAVVDIVEALESAGRTLITYEGESTVVVAGDRGEGTRRQWSHVLSGAASVPFITALTGVLRAGVPHGPELLTLDVLIDAVARSLSGVARSLSNGHDGHQLGLFRNRAARRSPLVGRVLVAAPDVGDPELHQAVILVLRQHPVEGTMAVRLNGAVVDRAVPPWAWPVLPIRPAVVRVGGPPSMTSGYVAVAVLRRSETPPPHFLTLRDRVGVLTEPPDPSRKYHSLVAVQLVRGYLGWPPGRIEELLASGSLRVVEYPLNDQLLGAVQQGAREEDLWARLVRPELSAPVGVPPVDLGLDELLDELVASLNGGEKLSLIVGDAVDQTTVVGGEDGGWPGLPPATRPGLRSLGRLLAQRGDEFAHQVFVTGSADDVARAVRNADHPATVLRHTEPAGPPTDDVVRVFSVSDLPVSGRGVDLMAGSITGDHVCVIGHNGISGAVVAALRLVGRLRPIQVTWVSTTTGGSPAETDRTDAIRRLLGVPVTFYFGVDVDRLFTQLCDRLGLPASPATLLDASVRFPSGEAQFVIDVP